jgi:hypothetical protein
MEPLFPPALLEMQRALADVLRHPLGVTQALQERAETPARAVLAWVVDAPPLSAAERLNVYAEGYFTRLGRNLQNCFPLTFQALGQEAFLKLAAHYYHQHPSDRPYIQESGRFLPNFLQTWPGVSDWLPELALLEWSAFVVLHAPEIPIEPEQLVLEQIALAPAVELHRCLWSWQDFWQEPTLIQAPTPQPSLLMMVRTPAGVQLQSLEPVAFELLHLLQQGLSLPAILANSELSEQISAEWLQNQFAQWRSQGVLYFSATPS